MTDNHNKSFFGQKVGMIVSSSSQTDPFIFLKFLKKKANGEWEKPSQREGKSIKISLEELIIILNVLAKKLPSWKSVHSFKNERTPIGVSWNGTNNDLWINVGDYGKNMKFPQTQFLKLLLEHILKEKIKYATSGTRSQKNNTKSDTIPKDNFDFFESNSYFEEGEDDSYFDTPSAPLIQESKPTKNRSKSEKSKQMIKARVKKTTEKAVLLCFGDGKEVWFPKSTIHTDFDSTQNTHQQSILVDEWILEKNQAA